MGKIIDPNNADVNLRKLMAEARTPHACLLEQTRGLVDKWEPKGLLGELNADLHGTEIIPDVSIRAADDRPDRPEWWASVILPLKRNVFGVNTIKEFVNIWPMNHPLGFIFYLDFKEKKE